VKNNQAWYEYQQRQSIHLSTAKRKPEHAQPRQATYHIQVLANQCTFVKLLDGVLCHARLWIREHHRPAQAAISFYGGAPEVGFGSHLRASTVSATGQAWVQSVHQGKHGRSQCNRAIIDAE